MEAGIVSEIVKKQPQVQNCFVYLGAYPGGCFYDKHMADEMLIQMCKRPGETIYSMYSEPSSHHSLTGLT